MEIFLLVGLVMAVVQADYQTLREFIKGNVEFAAEVYQQMVENTPDNFAVCILSVDTVLALVHAGSAGKTAEQLSSALRLPESDEKIQEVFTNISATLYNNKQYSFLTANKVYLQNGFEIKDQFKNIALSVFGSETQNIDFSNAEQAASEMNKWVEDKTLNRIKNIISPNSLNSGTRFVLINALFFRGTWEKPFRLSHTTKKPFHVTEVNQIDVDMMVQTNKFNYYESPEWGAKLLELKYKGEDISMTFILPNAIEGLHDLEEAFVFDILLATPKFSSEQVDIQIPKFKVESTIEFKPILKASGIVEAFEKNANFAGITNQSIQISEVIQQTYIEVDEKGTTAAAATAITLKGMSATVPHPKTFIADHPFIFIIKLGSFVLFIGRYKNAVN